MNQVPRKQAFQITGMTCGHCKSAVESAIRATEGVTAAQVDLKAGKAVVEGQFVDKSIMASVEEAGYEAVASN
jgi:copper chaperone CopZ